MNPPISRDLFVVLIADVGEHLAGNWDIVPNPEEWPMGAHLVDHDLHASLYFNQNGYTADGKKLVYSTPGGISVLDHSFEKIMCLTHLLFRILCTDYLCFCYA